SDLRRHARRLADSGISGTETRFRFFAPTALWLARRWPERLTIDWPDFEHRARIETFLPLLAAFAESPALDEYEASAPGWIERMKGPRESDAAFLIRRFAQLEMDDFAREALWDELDMPILLAPAGATPSRTRAKLPRREIAWQRGPLSRARPEMRDLMRRPR